MRAFLFEILDPVKDFYSMRLKKEITIIMLIPLFCGLICFCVGILVHPYHEIRLIDFSVDILNQILTILTLFVSFSMAYLSILITSSSKNVDKLKEKESKMYYLRGKACTLYQVLASEITYTLIFEIFFMVFVLAQRFLVYLFSENVLKIILAVNVSLFIHVMLMMLITIKNVYFSFWKSK